MSWAKRAVLFIDGNNWYHSLVEAQVDDRFQLDYGKISRKLIGPREWSGTRYYIGRVPQSHNVELYRNQRRFLNSLKATDRRITAHLGRLEPRPSRNLLADELLSYSKGLQIRIDKGVFQDLLSLARQHRSTSVMVEKAVDVMLAVDLVVMAERDEYDAAYLLSADGDFTPAVAAARKNGKKVYAVSPSRGAQLASVSDSFIRVDQAWFRDCYK